MAENEGSGRGESKTVINEEFYQKVYLEIGFSAGDLKEFRAGFARVVCTMTRTMSSDKMGLVHGGFIFSSANYAAMCAINNPNAVLIGAEVHFLAPVEAGSEVEFRAQALQNDTKKREVKVEGFVLGIKAFEGIFSVAIFDHHIFQLRIMTQ